MTPPPPARRLGRSGAVALALGALACGTERHWIGDPDAGRARPPAPALVADGAIGPSGPARPTRPEASQTGADAAEGWRLEISGPLLARRLAVFLGWRQSSPIDERALRAQTNEEVFALTGALLDDPASAVGVGAFYDDWLEARAFEQAQIAIGGLARPLVESMALEPRTFGSRLTLERSGTFADLVTGADGVVNDLLARLYEIPGISGPEFRWTPLPGRTGILTQAALLARGAEQSHNPAARGHLIRRALLCDPQVNPHADGAPPLTREPELTTRRRHEELLTNESCARCHERMDPLGFALEGFDGRGRPRTMEAGLPVDTVAKVVDVDGATRTARDARDLGLLLVKSPQAQLCFVQRWLAFALRRPLRPEDARSAAWAHERAFGGSGEGRLRAVIQAVTATRSFLAPD